MNAKAAWRSSVLPAVIVPAAVGTTVAGELRSRLDAQGYRPYALVDRGSYRVVDAPRVGDLLDVLAGIAAEITGRAAKVAEARALRLGPGDYLLTRHDRAYDDRPIELVLDLSPEPVAGADVYWRHRGEVYFGMPSTPGALAVVERGPTVMCNHAYVSRRWSGPDVVRLVVLLRDVAAG